MIFDDFSNKELLKLYGSKKDSFCGFSIEFVCSDCDFFWFSKVPNKYY